MSNDLYIPYPKIDRIRKLLHIGCHVPNPEKVPQIFRNEEWQEVRFDLDPNVKPDIVGSVTDLSAIPDNSMDAVYSAHTFEHLFNHEVSIAMSECFRVLMSDGCLLLRVPNLEVAAKLLLEQGLYSVAYNSKSGSVRPIDIIYGSARTIKGGNELFAHRTGFTAETLQHHFKKAGFVKLQVVKGQFDLHAVGRKPTESAS